VALENWTKMALKILQFSEDLSDLGSQVFRAKNSTPRER
jgi:hypothetical protein